MEHLTLAISRELRVRGTLSTQQLLSLGASRAAIGRMLADNHIVRVRRGVFVSPQLAGPELVAARLGGRVTGETLFTLLGAWQLSGSRPIHIAVSRNMQLPAETPGIRIHISRRHKPGLSASPEEAVEHLVNACSVDEAVIVLDSVINRRIMPPSAVMSCVAGSPRGRSHEILRLLDGSAESGLESITRLRLQRRGIRFSTQVQIGPYRADFLIGRSLIVEVLGKAYHANDRAFENDATREAYLMGRGYLVLRVTAEQVLTTWGQIECALSRIMAKDWHRRTPRPD